MRKSILLLPGSFLLSLASIFILSLPQTFARANTVNPEQTQVQVFVSEAATEMFALSLKPKDHPHVLHEKQILLERYGDMSFVVSKIGQSLAPSKSPLSDDERIRLIAKTKRLFTTTVFEIIDAPHAKLLEKTMGGGTVLLAKSMGMYRNLQDFANQSVSFKFLPSAGSTSYCSNGLASLCLIHDEVIQVFPDLTSKDDNSVRIHFVVRETQVNGVSELKLIDVSAVGIRALHTIIDEVAAKTPQQVLDQEIF
jgi:hypothetical protein